MMCKMWGKVSLILTIIIVFIILETEGKICPGFCVPQDLCINEGGRVLGYCVDQRACCEVKDRWNQSSCGASVHWENKPAHFVSPKYPGYSSGSLICQYEMFLDKNAVGVKLEFEKFELDVQKLFYFNGHPPTGDKNSNDDEKEESFSLKCDSDLFFIKGFSDWMTDGKCGNLNGYSMLLEIEKNENPERKIVLLFIMSSKRYRWRIRIQQIMTKKLKKSELCLETRMAEWEKNPNFLKKLNVLNAPAQSSKLDWSLMTQSSTTAQPWRWQANILLQLKEPVRQNNGANSAKNLHHFFCPEKLSSNYKIMCTGSIVDDRHILIPASCLLNSQLNLQDLKIEVNDPNACKMNTEPTQMYTKSLFDIESATIHFNFLKSMRTNDIAIIRIRKTINFNTNGSYAQPIRLYDEYILPETLFFSSIKTEIQDFAIAVTPENSAHCSAVQTVDLQLTPQSVKELEESHKFRGLLDSWLCFNITMKNKNRMKQDDVGKTGRNEKGKTPFLVGSLLMSSDGCGEKLKLLGIYNHVLSLDNPEDFNFLKLFDPNDNYYERYKPRYRHSYFNSTRNSSTSSSHQKVFWPLILYRPFLHNSTDAGGLNMNKSESRGGKSTPSSSFFFFTNLSLYRRWILMAIS